MKRIKTSPSNYDLTAYQVATALENFTEHVVHAEATLKRDLDRLPALSGRSLNKATQRCMAMEDFLVHEKSLMISEVEHMYEDALANVMCHYCAVDTKFFKKISEMAPDSPRVVPKVLTHEGLEHYQAICDITRNFLKSFPKAPTQVGTDQEASGQAG